VKEFRQNVKKQSFPAFFVTRLLALVLIYFLKRGEGEEQQYLRITFTSAAVHACNCSAHPRIHLVYYYILRGTLNAAGRPSGSRDLSIP